MTLVVSISIHPKTPGDAERLARALERLIAQDVRLGVKTAGASSEVEIACVSEQHLHETVDCLAREFGISAAVSVPRVLYREAVTRAADGEAKYAKHVNGRGEYAHVKVQISPKPSASGRSIQNTVPGGAIPDQFMPAVEQGIAEALAAGVLAGYPIEDVRVEILGGSYHDVDSSEASFRTAASLAARDAANKADPVLLEPVMRVEVTVPAEFEAEVTKSLTGRRGHLLPSERRGETQVIRALVPVARLWGYDSELRGLTFGRGTYTAEFETYMPVEPGNDDDNASPIGVPRRPAPKPRDSGIALPEPDDGVE